MIELYQGDCIEYMRTLADGAVDCVITDPPYGVGKAAWDDEFPTDWIPDAWRIAPRMLVMPGNTALIRAATAIGQYRDCIVLHNRNGMTLSAIAFGSYIPVLACGDWKWRAQPNLLPFNVTITEKINHPSPKPVAAMRQLIARFTEPGATVFDPFMGSGTTGVACVQTGRHFIGCEIDAGYFAIAKKRIDQAAMQPQLFAHAAPAAVQLEAYA
jgi:DNA modification methylase